MSYGAKSYKKTAIKTSSPEQILLMLYEAAIKSAKLAKAGMERNDVPEKCKHITKVHDIVMELSNTLDRSQNSDIVTQLDSLYDFCIAQLLRANIDNDLKAIDSVTSVLVTLYDGWVMAVDEVRKKGKAV